MSAAVLGAAHPQSFSPTSEPHQVGGEAGACPVCDHPEDAHELLLTSTVSLVICHESTADGECFRVRHARGIAFGACRRDPA